MINIFLLCLTIILGLLSPISLVLWAWSFIKLKIKYNFLNGEGLCAYGALYSFVFPIISIPFFVKLFKEYDEHKDYIWHLLGAQFYLYLMISSSIVNHYRIELLGPVTG